MEKKELTLVEAINKIQTDLDIFANKSGKNTMGKGYAYFTETDLYNALKPLLKETGLTYTIEADTDYKLYRDNNMWVYESNGILKLYKGADKINIRIVLAATNTDPAKAIGSALTYGTRYWLCKTFGIATEELDPDNDKNSKEVEKNNKRETKKEVVLDKGVEEFKKVVLEINEKAKANPVFKKWFKFNLDKLGVTSPTSLKVEQLTTIIKNYSVENFLSMALYNENGVDKELIEKMKECSEEKGLGNLSLLTENDLIKIMKG